MSVLAGVLVAALMAPMVASLGYAAREGARFFQQLPTVLTIREPPEGSVMLAADGSRLATFFEQNRLVVPLARIAPVMRQALLAVEDVRFYEHGALDLRGAVRALVENMRSGQVEQGGSSLSQQYVKNALVQAAGDDPAKLAGATEPTLRRKIRELRYAVALEQRLSKSEILERYLNLVYFGDGAYGVEVAARHYFSTTAAELTLPQAALLAGLVQRPGSYEPTREPWAAVGRRNVVLDRMAEVGLITATRAARAQRSHLGLRPTSLEAGCAASRAPFFCEYALAAVLADPALGRTPEERRRLLLGGRLTIRTTLDPRVQRAAQRAVDRHIEPDNPVATAIAVVEPGTGAVMAIATNRRFGDRRGQTKVNLAVDHTYGGSRGFQAGSTFKPFVLAAAVERRIPLTLRLNAPARVNISGFRNCATGAPYPPYSVGNFDGDSYGRINLRQATWRSVNTYFVQLERRTGQCRPARLAGRMGLRRADGGPLQAVPSFVLGTQEVSPLGMAEAFATFAARGEHCTAHPIVQVTDRIGRARPVTRSRCEQVLPARVAVTVNRVLTGVIDGPDPRRTGARLSLGRPAAGKTGTTNNNVAVWFVGYTPHLAAAVWAGYPEASKPLRNVVIRGQRYDQLFGGRLPGPIWQAAMGAALSGVPARAL